MQTRQAVSIRTLVTLAGASVGIIALPAIGGEVTSPASAPAHQAQSSSAREVLQRATDAMARGRVIEARELLMPLTADSAAVGLSDEERTRVFGMVTTAKRKLDQLPPLERSLQTAEFAAQSGDLRLAQEHAQAVASAPKATNEQATRAKAVLGNVAESRARLAPTVGHSLDLAQAALDSGHVGEARTLIDTIHRSGVDLAAADADRLSKMQAMIVDQQSAPALAGMLQPGVVKPRDPAPADAPAADAPKADEPKTEPKTEPKADEPKPAEPKPAEPAPAEPAANQPAVIEPAPAAAPAQPAAEDLVQQAQRLGAQALLAEAEVAYIEKRLNEAQGKYLRLKTQFSNYLNAEQAKTVDNRLAEISVLLGRGGAGQDILGDLTKNREIARQNLLAEFENFIFQAGKALESGDTERARQQAASAGVRLGSGRNYLNETEYETLSGRQKNLLTEIARREESNRVAQKNKDTASLEAQIRADKETTRQAKERKIRENIDRVRALQQEMKYEEALQVVDQILFLDPINPTGLVLKDVLTDSVFYRRALGNRSRQTYAIAMTGLDNSEAGIPPRGIMDYPTEWPTISNLRGTPLAFQEPEENRRILTAIANKRIPTVAFKDNSFADCIAFVQAVSQQNVDIDWASLEAVGVDKEAQVTLNLSNVPVTTVLDRLMTKVSQDPNNGAAWGIIDGMLTVASREVISRNRTTHIYDIRDLLIQVPNFDQAPEFDLASVLQSRRAGGGGGGGGGQGQGPFRGAGGAQQGLPAGRTLEERTQELIRIITQNVDTNSWSENGGDIGSIQQFQGNLIITQTPANHRAVNGILSKLRDVRAMQINVETRFLLVNQNFFEQIGVDIDVYFNAKNNQIRAARAAAPGNQIRASDFFDFSAGGLQRGIDGRAASATTTGLTPVRLANPSPLSVVGAGQNSLGITESLVSSPFGNQILSQSPALGIAGQFLDDIQVDFLVKATQADNRTVSLTAPRLTFTNGQTSNIIVATQTAFVSDLEPVVSESAVGFDPTLETISDGVRLLVEGTVSADRRYVTLNVDASVARLERFNQVAVTAVAGGQLVNSAQTSSFIQLPVVTVTQVKTTVTVPDQGTILLGGQRLTTETEAESGVPVLSKIPFLNRFFSNRVEVKEESMLIILLKPTILIQSEQEERNFPGLQEAVRATFGG